ncbi:hypothetical protein BKA56DRAFT_615578 [Ilyonectria sp. MPI-CAGE-AT-0026]|nr:hypothetical protein BKA56DRAFT_615578 [Ilyonectria sp. MPI-CAGE-AT-0026]
MKVDETADITTTRQAGGGFIYNFAIRYSNGRILGLGINMLEFPDFSVGPYKLTGGHIVTASRLMLNNKNTSTYARSISSSWEVSSSITNTFTVILTAGVRNVLSGSVAGATALMAQDENGQLALVGVKKAKEITSTSGIDQVSWGTIVCPSGKVCRALSMLVHWDGFSLNFVAMWIWLSDGMDIGMDIGMDFAHWTVTLERKSALAMWTKNEGDDATVEKANDITLKRSRGYQCHVTCYGHCKGVRGHYRPPSLSRRYAGLSFLPKSSIMLQFLALLWGFLSIH